MSVVRPVLYVPKGIVCANEQLFLEKVARFAELGASGLHVVADYDRALTVSHARTKEDVTTWHILGKHLSEEGKRRYRDLFQRYRGLELEDKLTVADAVEWWRQSLQLYVDEAVNMHRVEVDFLAHASIRPGVQELFSFCRKQSIPTVILSAGIRDVINVWTRAYGIQPYLVLSTVLLLAPDGTIIGWDEQTLIHILNKHEAGHAELSAIRAARPNVVAFGDGMGDADMVEGDANALRLRIFDPRADEVVDMQAVRQKTFAKFDALIETGTLHPILDMLKFIC